MRRVSFLGLAAILVAVAATAQSSLSHSQSGFSPVAASESSSNPPQFMADTGLDDSGNTAALAAAPAAGGSGGSGGGGGTLRHLASHGLAFEVGAGFNAPFGNDTPYVTWGGNFTVGAGLHLPRGISLLGEYQFIDDKLPGAFIAAEGTSAGNTHINSITASPVIDLFPKKSNSIYVVGGWGYYHKSTNFSDYECCSIYGYDVEVTVGSFTSNQWGGNGGLGFYHRLGGPYGDDKTKLFAEARYLFLHTPPVSETNGLGTTELIPVTLGVRW